MTPKDTLIDDCDLSIRIINSFHANVLEFESIKGLLWRKEVTIGHFEKLRKSELYAFKNISKKSIKEIEKMFSEAGIVLID